MVTDMINQNLAEGVIAVEWGLALLSTATKE